MALLVITYHILFTCGQKCYSESPKGCWFYCFCCCWYGPACCYWAQYIQLWSINVTLRLQKALNKKMLHLQFRHKKSKILVQPFPTKNLFVILYDKQTQINRLGCGQSDGFFLPKNTWIKFYYKLHTFLTRIFCTESLCLWPTCLDS